MTAHAAFEAVVTLPWPPRGLSPNARIHWAQRSRMVRKARNDARLACMAEGIRGLGWDAARVSITFHAPDNRHRDLDNMLASSKALLDGIADATGIDDSCWTIRLERGAPVRGGAVVVRLSPATTEGRVEQ